MKSEMVERVARAVRKNRFVRTRREGSFDETVPPTEQELDDARAAIAAMREPAETVMNAGIAEIGADDSRHAVVLVADLWLRMISTALSDDVIAS
jgi:hypothetical protein